jgi:hypothetical protein
MSFDASSLTKTAEIVRNVANDLSRNHPLAISLAITSSVSIYFSLQLPHGWFVAAVLLTVFLWIYFIQLIWFAWQPVRKARHHLRRLGKEEKLVLGIFLKQDIRTKHVNMFYAPTASLIAKGLLTVSTSVIPALSAPVVIQDYVWSYLRSRPELVGLSKDDIGSEDWEDDSPYMTKP